ncbi:MULTISPECIES: hypothetical protein [Mycobacterium avium complex (MAC)]|uniref:hypothetical protein n=1 Tax=Mycobacterium avium complex (MAC) TaxID=120793 RepID=UPI001E3B9193|nr:MULTISPECIES: hypothetical protein [Mycobacterium avium complex (MAC)]
MPTPPESTKTSLRQRLKARANERWPHLADLTIRHHAGFAYVSGQLTDGTTLPLLRLRHGGSANSWGFAIHLASRNGYQNSVLPNGYPVGTPEEALDCACGLYLNDPTAWTTPGATVIVTAPTGSIGAATLSIAPSFGIARLILSVALGDTCTP